MNETQTNIDEIQTFCKFYFSHPAFSGLSEPWIRLKILPSEYLKKRVENKEVKVSLKPNEYVLTRKGITKNLENLSKLNSAGFDMYYFCNLPDRTAEELAKVVSARYVSNEQIKRILYLPIDWDNWSVELPTRSEVFDQLGLLPTVIYQTSWRGDGLWHQASQAIIAINCEDIAEGQKAAQAMTDVMGSCPVHDPKRLLRLPGTINWKKAVSVETACKSELLWTCGSVDLPIYSFSEIMHCLEDFKGCETQLALKQMYLDNHVKTLGPESAGTFSNSDYGRWEDAFEKAQRGVWSIGEGSRHNALLVWGGQMSASHMLWSVVVEKLAYLRRHAFEVPYVGSSEDTDYMRLIRDLRVHHDKIQNEAAEMFKAITSEEVESMEELPNHTPAIYTNGHDKALIPWVPPFAVTEEGQDPVTKTAKLLVKQFYGETKEEYLSFLINILIGVSTFQTKNSGSIMELVEVIAKRINKAGLNYGNFFACAVSEKIETSTAGVASGGSVKYICRLMPLSKGGGQLFVETILMQLSKIFSIKKVQQDIADSEKIKNITNLDNLKTQFAAKSTLQTAFCQHLLSRGEHLFWLRQKELSRGNVISFQNGYFDFQAWQKECGIGKCWRDYWYENPQIKTDCIIPQLSWVKYPTSSPISLDAQRVDELIELMGHGQFERNLDKLSLDDCPKFKEFLATPFPKEPGSVLCLLRIIGYCLLEKNPRQKYFYFEGVAGGGKGTIAEIICYLVGDQAWMPLNPIKLKSDSWLGPLEGAKVVVVDEIGATGKKDYATNLQEIARVVGAQKIDSRALYESSKKAESTQKFILTTNEPLNVPDAAGRQERRVVPIKFSHKPETLLDNLSTEIVENEGEKIACYALSALLSAYHLREGLFSAGLGTPEQHASIIKGKAAFEQNSKELDLVLNKFCVKRDKGVIPTFLIKEIVVLWIRQEHERKRYYDGLAKNIVEILEVNGFKQERLYIPLPDFVKGKLPDRCIAWENMGLDTNAILEDFGMSLDQFGEELKKLLPKERDWLCACEILRLNNDGFSEIQDAFSV